MNDACAFAESPELSRYLFDEVSAAEKATIEAHLASCPSCESELRMFRSTIELVRKNEGASEKLAPASRERVMQVARSAVQVPKRRIPWLVLVQSMAALLIVSATYLYVNDRMQGKRERALMASRDDRVRPASPPASESASESTAWSTSQEEQLRALGYIGNAKRKAGVAGEADRERLSRIDYGEGRKDVSVVASKLADAEQPAMRDELRTAQAPDSNSIIKRPSDEPRPVDSFAVARTGQDGGAELPALAEQLKTEGGKKAELTELGYGSPAAKADGGESTKNGSNAHPFAPPSDGSSAPAASNPAPAGAARGSPTPGRNAARRQLEDGKRGLSLGASPAAQQSPPATTRAAGATTAGAANEAKNRENTTLKEIAASRDALATSAEASLAQSSARQGASLDAGAKGGGAGKAQGEGGASEEARRANLERKAPEELADKVALIVDRDEVEVAGRINELFARLSRQPGESPRDMFFRYWGDHVFVEASENPISTFAADVDAASYTLARAYLASGNLPAREQVRTEEFVNYFKSQIAPPEKGVFRIQAEAAPSPFADANQVLLKVGLKGREVAKSERKACALTFVVDVSGSMREGNRLELVKDSLRVLVDQLDEGDRIGIVAFSSGATRVLDPVAVSAKERILAAIATLHPNGSTNAAAGLLMGYEMASHARIEKAMNRVILCSDGVANTGVTDQAQMLDSVATHRREGIFLNCVGVGMGNHNDALLEQLADKGDGQCVYFDRIEEARRVFAEQLTATLETIARDVKIQVEFAPSAVLRYRQIGYENRALANRDFRNDQIDAGEVGAGHEVVALYELTMRPDAKGQLADIRVRYKDAEIPAEVSEIHRTLDASEMHTSFDATNPRFQLSTVAAEFAELLRQSYWAANDSLANLFPIAERVAKSLPDDQSVAELCALIRQASELKAQHPDDLARATDAVMRNNYLIVQLEDRGGEDAALEQLLQQNAKLRREIEVLLKR